MRVNKIESVHRPKWERKTDPHERPHDFQVKDSYTKSEVIEFWEKVLKNSPQVDLTPLERFLVDNFDVTPDEVATLQKLVQKKADSEKSGM